MRTGDKALFLYDLVRGGLSQEALARFDEALGGERRQRLIRAARDEGRFEGLGAALEQLPAAARQEIRAAAMEATRAAIDAGPADYVFMDEELRQAKALGVLEGKRDGLLVLLMRRGLSVTQRQLQAIAGCADAHQVDRWLSAVMTTASTEALLAE